MVDQKWNLEGRHEAAANAHRSILVRWGDRQSQRCWPSLLVLALLYSVSCFSSHQLPPVSMCGLRPTPEAWLHPYRGYATCKWASLPTSLPFQASIGDWACLTFQIDCVVTSLIFPLSQYLQISSFSHSCMRSANYDKSLIPELHELMVRVFLTPSSAELQSSS